MEFSKFLFFFALILLVKCRHPILYEINVRPWLYELSKKYGKSITKLKDIPLNEFDYLKENGIDIIWMMGIWQLGPYGLEFDKTIEYYSDFLPDWKEEDVIGSPYAITEYTCNPDIGTNDDLIWLREEINKRKMKLMLDFVPNHTAVDAPIAASNPKLYIRAPEGKKDPERYSDLGFAFGRYSNNADGWKDVIQLNYWEEETRKYMKDNLMTVLSFADGVRFDSSSLVLNDVFVKVWEEELNYWGYKKPQEEFYEYAFREVKSKYPDAILLAEVYEDWETELIYNCGFHYTYNKPLLNSLIGNSSDVNKYFLNTKPEFLAHSAHFVENHDENRVVFSMKDNIEKAKAAGTIAATIGGMVFINHGQWSGYKNKLEVHLRRASDEMEDGGVKLYYRKLMKIIQDPAFTSSNFYYINNKSGEKKDDFIAYLREEGDSYYLIVINYSDSVGCANIPINNIKGTGEGKLFEMINDVEYIRNIESVKNEGLIVCLYPWKVQIFKYNY